MYCVYGESGSSLLIESVYRLYDNNNNNNNNNDKMLISTELKTKTIIAIIIATGRIKMLN